MTGWLKPVLESWSPFEDRLAPGEAGMLTKGFEAGALSRIDHHRMSSCPGHVEAHFPVGSGTTRLRWLIAKLVVDTGRGTQKLLQQGSKEASCSPTASKPWTRQGWLHPCLQAFCPLGSRWAKVEGSILASPLTCSKPRQGQGQVCPTKQRLSHINHGNGGGDRGGGCSWQC